MLRRMLRPACLLLILAASIGLLASLASSPPATAAPAPSIALKGITLTPAIENIDLHKNQIAANFTIMVVNNTKSKQTLSISSVDFKSLNDSGGLAFIGNNAGQLDHKYGLASWLGTPAVIDLQPNQTKPVPITVQNRADLSPGGHYAAVLFKVQASGSGGNHVALNQVVSTLVFVRKIEGERYGINLTRSALSTNWWHVPDNIDLFFRNTGNVQAIPRGLVTISSPMSHEVARGIINTDSSLVLPESNRLIRTALFNTGSAWLPGRYHVHIAYHYDGSTTMAFYDGAFWYFNVLTIGLGVAGLVLAWYIIRTARRLYHRWKQRRQRRPGPPRPPHRHIEVQSD